MLICPYLPFPYRFNAFKNVLNAFKNVLNAFYLNYSWK